jgi:hypothetical protein
MNDLGEQGKFEKTKLGQMLIKFNKKECFLLFKNCLLLPLASPFLPFLCLALYLSTFLVNLHKFYAWVTQQMLLNQPKELCIYQMLS